MLQVCKRFLMLCSAICAFSLMAHADSQLLTNGGFETGDLTGWSLGTPSGAASWQASSGIPSPLTGNVTPGAHSGIYYAAFDEFGSGVADIYQGFTVQANTTYTFSFDMFVNDFQGTSGSGTAYFCNSTGLCTQQLYTADTPVSGGNSNPWVFESFDITGFLDAPGQTDYVAFFGNAAVDGNPVVVGVDDASLIAHTSPVPEPSGLLTVPMIFITGRQWYKMRRTRQS